MRIKRIAIAWWIVLMIGVGSVSARELLNQDECIIAPNQTISGNLFVMCRTLVIEGTIEGNLYGAASDAVITGHVLGDIYLVGSRLFISGTVGDDVHFGGGVLFLQEGAQFDSDYGDLYAATITSTIEPGVEVTGSVISTGYQMLVYGRVARELAFSGSALRIEGSVAGDVDARVGGSVPGDNSGSQQLKSLFSTFNIALLDPGLVISESGVVGGSLIYSAPQAGDIRGTLESPARFTEIGLQPFDPIQLEAEAAARNFNVYTSSVINEFTTLLLIGLLGLVIAPAALQMPIRYVQLRPLPSLAVGMLVFIISWVVVAVLVLLSLLIVAVFLLLQLNDLALAMGALLTIFVFGSASVVFFVAVFISRVIVCLTFGRFLLRLFGRYDPISPRTPYFSLVAGVALLALIAPLPGLVGLLFNAFTAFVGFGAILNIVLTQLRSIRETPPSVITAGDNAVVVPTLAPPPPRWEQVSSAPGADNLPPGFRWWDEG